MCVVVYFVILWTVGSLFLRSRKWCCIITSSCLLNWIQRFLSDLADWIMILWCIFIQVTSPAWSKQTCWTRLWPVWSLSIQSTSKAYGSPASSPRTPRWGPSTAATGMYIKSRWCLSYPSSTSVSGRDLRLYLHTFSEFRYVRTMNKTFSVLYFTTKLSSRMLFVIIRRLCGE